MPDRTRHRIKMKICGGGGPASHIDQGRHSRFTARVLHSELHVFYLSGMITCGRNVKPMPTPLDAS